MQFEYMNRKLKTSWHTHIQRGLQHLILDLTKNCLLIIFFLAVHQWRRLPSVPQDLFRSGGLSCGSLPATLLLLPKLWTHPGRLCQWDYAPCINTTHCLHATSLHARITSCPGPFWRSFTSPQKPMRCRLSSCGWPTSFCLSCRRGLSEGCFVLLLSAGGWTAQGQAGVWVLLFFCAQDNMSDNLTQHFNFPFICSCLQALWQRWERSPRQLCKFCEIKD